MISPIAVLIAFVVGILLGLCLCAKFIDFVCNVAAKRDRGLPFFGAEDARDVIATIARQSDLLRWVQPSEIAPEDSRVHGATTMKKSEGLAEVITLRNDSDRRRGVSVGIRGVKVPPKRTTPLTLAEQRQLEADVQASLDRVHTGVKR